ncbi:MAG: type II secretion system F family protein [Lentisphaerae bacterium]|nr:type II secretion system F family protein [Lentisphaerota bacterium]
MQTFEYRGFDREGRASRGLIEALSVKDAREKLALRGILADRLSATGRRARLTVGARAVLYRELSALLAAGLPLVRSLEILIASPETERFSGVLAGVRDRVREGGSLAEALAEAGRFRSPFELAIVQVAERSGTLEAMIARLGEFLEEQEQLRERVQSALVYPAIVLAVGICVAVLMLGLLIPRAAELLADSRAGMPALTRGMMALGRTTLRWGWLALVLLGGGGAVARDRIRRRPELRRAWDRRLFGLPLVGRGYRILAALRFARALAILLRGGVSVVEGLALAGRSTGSPWIAHMAEAEAEAVRHGSSLSDAVRRIPPLAASLPGWIQVGEAGGGLSGLMESAGKRYQGQWDHFVSRSLSLLEPALILAIGAFVLLVTLSVLLPIISLTRNIGG